MTSASTATVRRLAGLLVKTGSPAQDEQLAEAARLDHRVRAAELPEGLVPNWLVEVVPALATGPLATGWTAGLSPARTRAELAAGRPVPEIALRHALASAELPLPGAGAPSAAAELVAKDLRAELDLPQPAADRVATRFVSTYLLLSFATTAAREFTPETVAEAARELAQDESGIARFVAAFWA
ncbi:hypothetical protein M8542_24125 [Amycolatopsis sp. OK19-0408]|uniref:Uncharacterized protein n=1 Tax=Amycolatopsis iheyensis TaxID=2945988 RepID=A0A9X2SL74_9PSEU|nr:hypothetical protein [Amycolatopsis iheyensis]MCR6485918.1 hypothetical protein [Amycolatopsis iheyensis]